MGPHGEPIPLSSGTCHGPSDNDHFVQIKEDPQYVTQKEDKDDAHEDHRQVVFLTTTCLMVYRRPAAEALSATILTKLDVFVNLN